MATIFKSTGHAQFDKLLEKATSNLLLEPEWTSIISICDLIRQKDCQPKYAVAQLKKKLHHPNPHVSYFGLQVLESVVKNCGSQVHDEIATKQFMEELRELAKTTQHENIREKILELIQTWAHAFRKIPSYRAVQDVLNIMKTEGAKFPPLVEADAMFVADQAPEWADGECCHRCRVEFSFTQRKHHCRACGQIFCGKCSSKECTLPRFGIEKEVRVCDACFEKYGREGGGSSGASTSSDDQRASNGLPSSAAKQSSDKTTTAAPTTATPGPTQKELELAEEEQLQLALAISQSEAEAKEQEMKKKKYNTVASKVESTRTTSPPPPQPQSILPAAGTAVTGQEDPELSRYLNRSYWENKSSNNSNSNTQDKLPSSFTPSAPLKLNTAGYQQDLTPAPTPPIIAPTPLLPQPKTTEQDITIDNFVETLRSQIEMFVNRMKSNSSRGRPIANDTSVQSLFMSITHMHSQLLAYIQVQDNARAQYELLQDKLNQVRDARAALDDLRNEHAEALRRQQEEQERIRAFQMAQKLALMRQKKNEYLQYQRQLAMQRMQEQEREMQMRIQQQQAQAWPAPPPPQPPVHGYMPVPQQQQPMYQQPWVPNGAPQQQQQQLGGGGQIINSPTGQPPTMMYDGQQQMPGQDPMIQHQQVPQQQQQQVPPPPPTGQLPQQVNHHHHHQQQQQQMMSPPPQQQIPQQQQLNSNQQIPPQQTNSNHQIPHSNSNQQMVSPPPPPQPQQSNSNQQIPQSNSNQQIPQEQQMQPVNSQQQIIPQQVPSTQTIMGSPPPSSHQNLASPEQQQQPQPTPIAELISFD